MNRIPKDKCQKRDLKVVNVSCFHAPSFWNRMPVLFTNFIIYSLEGHVIENDMLLNLNLTRNSSFHVLERDVEVRLKPS